MADTATKSTLTARCSCGSVHLKLEVPTAKLPLRVHTCSCTICRYTHGTMCIFHFIVPDTIQPEFIAPSSKDNLTGYKHATSKSERFFCSKCGCHIGDCSMDDNQQWNFASSIFTDHSEDVFQIKINCLTDCAPGGSVADWLPRIGDRELTTWNPAADDPEWDLSVAESKKEFDADGNERLRAQCHCGGVSFTIPRPTLAGIKDDPYIKKWISPEDPNKWDAMIDVCNDCRLVDGTHFAAWTFVPGQRLEPPMKHDLSNYQAMKVYHSSPGVYRGFCGTCGATVAYSCDERAPTDKQAVVDISIGILRAPNDVFAQDWLTWRTSRVGWKDAGMKYDPVFVKSLEEGLAAWGERTHGKVLDIIIGE